MTRITPPTDAEVQTSVDRVADRLLPRLRARNLHPWRLRILAGAAGAGLFLGGLGVGAAAYGAVVANQARIDDSPFGIDCYTNADSTDAAVRIDMDSASLLRDPVTSCHSEQTDRSQANIFDVADTQYLVAGKAECLVISSPGAPDAYSWKAGQSPTTHELTPFWVREPLADEGITYPGSSTKPEGFPADCLPVTIPAAPVIMEPLGACRIDSRHAAVFRLEDQSVDEVCRSHGFTVWGS
jgi:hypothetical protein